MSKPVLTVEELLAWNDKTSQNWHRFLSSHPELLEKPCDIAGTKTIGELLQHIVAVELRYAQRLADLPITEYSGVPYDSVDSLYETHTRALELFQQSLAAETSWDEEIDFPSRTQGRIRSTRKTILFHALLHSIRHYAQLSTLARQLGIQPDWLMDYLAMHMERLP
jgi:uncharacterized damage-inducible protein DinB